MFYVLDENNNKVEAFDKQGVLALLEQAIKEGTLDNILADSAAISKIKCCVSGEANKIAFITEATYNQMKAEGTTTANTWYFITDDSTADNIDQTLENLNNWLANLESVATETQEKTNGHEPRIAALENNFTEGVAKKARITNFTNEDIEACQGSSVDTRFEQITDVLHMWIELGGIIHNLGLVRMPARPTATGESNITKAYSSPIFITKIVNGETENGTAKSWEELVLLRLEITCQKYTGSGGISSYYIYHFYLTEYRLQDQTIYYSEGSTKYVKNTIVQRDERLTEEDITIYWRNIE